MYKIKVDEEIQEIADASILRLHVRVDKGIASLTLDTGLGRSVPVQDIIDMTLDVQRSDGNTAPTRSVQCCDVDDVAVALYGPPTHCTFVHSVDNGRDSVPSGPWIRADLEHGDVSTLVLGTGTQVRFKIVLISKSDGAAIYVDPIIRNGSRSVSGLRRGGG